MEYCALCGRVMYGGNPYFSCPDCREQYQQQIDAGIFPPGLDLEARSQFSMVDWMKLKLIEREVQQGKMTPAQAKTKMNDRIASINEVSRYAQQNKTTNSSPDFKLY